MKFYTALTIYGILAILATLTLDGQIRWVVWIVLAYFAVRTYIAHLQKP